MRLKLITPKKATRDLLRFRPLHSEMDLFKQQLKALLEQVNEDETEENQKTYIRDFLRETYYKNTNHINTRGRTDLVIHLGKSEREKVGVIIEAKRPKNAAEMISAGKPNVKALQELVLYYLRERFGKDENIDIKYCIATNVYEWYIIEARYFDNLFAKNKKLEKEYREWLNKEKVTANTDLFYNSIIKPFIDKLGDEVTCIYFDIRDYKRGLMNPDINDDRKLIYLYKVLSPYFLLKAPGADSNTLNNQFYKELLHIIGLEERKDSGKVVIDRKQEGKRNDGSLIENTLTILQAIDPLHRISNRNNYGNTRSEQLYNVALELSLTWINRILFLKLLEGQLVNYHCGDRNYRFLNIEFIQEYDELWKLFHQVLAVPHESRSEAINKKFAHIPYLNSSLFESSELEHSTIHISNLDNRVTLPLIAGSRVRVQSNELPSLQYLFRFLDAYDFGSDSKEEEMQEDNKPLINASVLGKVFEKINGYKDGSIYTPGFITTYMCRQAIRPIVVQKFAEKYGWTVDTLDDVRNYLVDHRSAKEILEFNNVIDNIHICDPAVGSGHFLVSALNELISIKAELGILADNEGLRFRDYEVGIVNDELLITDSEGNAVVYMVSEQGHPLNNEVQRLQCTLFHEKQRIIENCLFGVDINANSVKICRLRLWIELLKHAYYKKDGKLETLPNIDINIKTGNSLLSRFPLNTDLSEAFKNQRYNLTAYRLLVDTYRHSRKRSEKADLLSIIEDIKKEYTSTIYRKDPRRKKIAELRGQLELAKSNYDLFGKKLSDKEQKASVSKMSETLSQKEKELEEAEKGAIYRNAFEWRFEFPEVLDQKGNFTGFDVVIGNPPYVQIQKLAEDEKKGLETQNFQSYTRTGDLYQLFYERGLDILYDNGKLSFITSNKWMRTNYGGVTRKLLATGCKTETVIDFGMAQMFDVATTYTNILTATKSLPAGTIRICRIKDDYDNSVLLEDYFDFASVDIENPGEASWIAYDKNEFELIRKIVEKGKPIKSWGVTINRGILTGLNEAFVIDSSTRDRLINEDPNSERLIRKILRGEDVKAYEPEWSDKWLIGTFPSLNIDIDTFPAIKNYLLKFKERLTPKPRDYNGNNGKWQGRKSGAYEWYETQDSIAYYQDFLKPKIIYPNMTKFMPFVYDKHQFFTNDKSFIMTGGKLEFLTCFLNSSLFKFAFKDYFPELLGDTRELRKVFFETIPVKEPSDEIPYKQVLEDILKRKKQKQPTAALEGKVDDLVFDLYKLTTDERLLVRSSVGKSIGSRELISDMSLSES